MSTTSDTAVECERAQAAAHSMRCSFRQRGDTKYTEGRQMSHIQVLTWPLREGECLRAGAAAAASSAVSRGCAHTCTHVSGNKISSQDRVGRGNAMIEIH